MFHLSQTCVNFYRQQLFRGGGWWVCQGVSIHPKDMGPPGAVGLGTQLPPDMGNRWMRSAGERCASYWNTFFFKIINKMLFFKNSLCVSSSSILYFDNMFKLKQNFSSCKLCDSGCKESMALCITKQLYLFSIFTAKQLKVYLITNFGLPIIISLGQHKTNDVH